MRCSLAKAELARYVASQLSRVFPDTDTRGTDIEPFVAVALDRIDLCFSRLKLKGYHDESGPFFDHLHTDQYASFLSLLANSIYRREGDLRLAAKVFALNKALHALDIFYEVELPDVFALQHPVGTVLGRARYANFLFVYQRCSVGSNLDGETPQFGEGVVLFGGAGVIGRCLVGSNCWLSAGALVMNADVPSNSVVFGTTPHNTVKATRRNVVRDLFRSC